MRSPRPRARQATRGALIASALATAVGGCANLSNLTDYSARPSAEGGEDSTATTPLDRDATDGISEQAASTDASPGSDAGALDEAGDALERPADAGVDATAICRAQCSGCCDSNGVCHGGQSTSTCGVGGGACQDCSRASKVCDPQGACVAPSTVDSGPPSTCVPTNCTNTCPLLPLAEAPCCKPDQTCGCGAVLGILNCN